MKFTLTIDCDNAAFYPYTAREDGGHPAGSDELFQLIHRANLAVAEGEDEGTLHDSNGNTVGHWSFEEGDAT